MPAENDIPSCFVFLYGTLRTGSGNPHAPILHSRCTHIDQGLMPGRLFRVNQQYAAIYDPAAEETVVGDIVQLPCDMAELILNGLDRYEGIAPGQPGEPAFRREKVDILRPDGTRLSCWTWLYALSTSGCSQIRHGDALSRA